MQTITSGMVGHLQARRLRPLYVGKVGTVWVAVCRVCTRRAWESGGSDMYVSSPGAYRSVGEAYAAAVRHCRRKGATC